MKKIEVKNRNYYIILIIIIGLFLVYNLIVSIYTNNIIGVLPFTIQLLIIYLLISKNQYSIIGAKIWAGIFLIGGPGLQVIGILLQYWGGTLEQLFSTKFLFAAAMILTGILIIVLSNGIKQDIDS